MKASLYFVTLFLALGAVLSLPVAWACQTYSRVNCVDLGPGEDPREWWSAPKEWATPLRAVQHGAGFGRTTQWLLGAAGGDVGLKRAGWPFSSFEYAERDRTVRGVFAGAAATEYRWALVLPQAGYVPKRLWDQPLPLRPVPAGLAGDAVVGGGVLWLVFGAWRSVRGVFRARRALCPACGYPAGVSAVCTECGRALPSSVRARAAPTHDGTKTDQGVDGKPSATG